MKLIRARFLTRLWYYFRIGYSTYLTFALGYISTLVTIYYLAIKNLPTLLDLFPHFVPFAILATVIGGPASVAIGWLHFKRTPAYSSEQDISVEANPYNYKTAPGKERDAIIPMFLELLLLQEKALDAQKLLSEEEKDRIHAIQDKLRVLISGGMIGTPRRSL